MDLISIAGGYYVSCVRSLDKIQQIFKNLYVAVFKSKLFSKIMEYIY